MSAPLFRCLHISNSSNRGLLNDPYIWPNLKIYDFLWPVYEPIFIKFSKYSLYNLKIWSIEDKQVARGALVAIIVLFDSKGHVAFRIK